MDKKKLGNSFLLYHHDNNVFPFYCNEREVQKFAVLSVENIFQEPLHSDQVKQGNNYNLSAIKPIRHLISECRQG